MRSFLQTGNSKAHACQGTSSTYLCEEFLQGAAASGLPSTPPANDSADHEASAGSTPRPRTPNQSVAAHPAGC